MESVFNISGCAIENQVKFATCTLLDAALTWWNGQIRTLGPGAYAMTWEVLKKKMTDKFVANENEKIDKYISGLPDNIFGNVKSSKPRTLDETIELTNDLIDQKLRTYTERPDNQRKTDDTSRNNHGHQQQPFKNQNVAKVYNMGTGERKPYEGSFPKSSGNANVANAQRDGKETPKGNGCFECGASGHFKRDCPKLKNKNGGNRNAQEWMYAVGNAERNGNASINPNSNIVTGTFILNNRDASILFDTGTDTSFISIAFSSLRVFWGADEELSDGGSLRVIMYGYDGLPMLPVAPPSPHYIPGPEEPHTPLAQQDVDEHEPIGRAHTLAEEQPLPPVVSPTAETPGVYNMGTGERKPYNGNLPKCTKCHFHHNGPCTQKYHKCNKVRHFACDYRSSGNTNVMNAQRNNGANPKGNGCFELGATRHFKRDCPKLKKKDGEKVNAPGWVYAVGNAEKRENASRDPNSNVVTGTFLLNNRYASILFDIGADRSFISTALSSLIDIVPTPLGNSYDVELADGKIVRVDTIIGVAL
nr:hypothetical protein [Tanacetum cinerariifolium]